MIKLWHKFGCCHLKLSVTLWPSADCSSVSKSNCESCPSQNRSEISAEKPDNLKCVPKPVTVLYPMAKTNHKSFSSVILTLSKKKKKKPSYLDLLCLLLSCLNNYAKYPSSVHISKPYHCGKKKTNSVLTPFNSCMCFVAKTAIRASSGLCLEHKHSVGYFAKFLLVIFTKEISHWFWLLNLFHFGLCGSIWKRRYWADGTEIKCVRQWIIQKRQI